MTKKTTIEVAFDEWTNEKPQRIDIGIVEEMCRKLASSLVEYQSDPQSSLFSVSQRLQNLAKAIYRIDGRLNPERHPAGNLHRDESLNEARLNGAPDELGMVRAIVDEIAAALHIQHMLHKSWKDVWDCLHEKWLDQNPPKIDPAWADRLRWLKVPKAPKSANEERDKWMYEQKKSGKTHGEILAALKRHNSAWDCPENEQSVGQAITRYCDRNSLERLRRKQNRKPK